MKICLRRSLIPAIKVSEMRFTSRFKRRVLKGHCKHGCCFSPSDRSASPKPAGVRRRLTDAPAAVWRSRADDPAGTDGEPEGAMAQLLLPSRTYSRRKSTKKNSSQNIKKTIHRTEQDQCKRVNGTRRTERGGASARPFSFAPQGRDVFAAQKAGLSPALHPVMRPPLIPAKIFAWQLYGADRPGASQSC